MTGYSWMIAVTAAVENKQTSEHAIECHFLPPPNILDHVLRFSFFSDGASFVSTFLAGEGALIVRDRAGGCAAALKRVTWCGLVECLIPGAPGVFAPGGSLKSTASAS
jgi:hypothetical protein